MNYKTGKKKSRVCLVCDHEIELFNNDEEFSWDMHKQETFHLKARQKGKNNMSNKESSNIFVENMLNLFVSNKHLDELVVKLQDLAQQQFLQENRNLKVIQAVAHVFSTFYLSEFQVISFGSRITGLTTTDMGDLDIFVDTTENGENSFVGNAALENWALHRAAQYMKSSDDWANVNPVLSCRTPILKALHFETKMQCDITVMNGLGIVNTKLMKLLLKNIPYLRQLILVIREWSYECNFVKEINNYALSLLVVFFLQIKKYAPPVDVFKYEYTGPVQVICGYECIDYELVPFEKVAVNSISSETLKSLLIGFFDYYSKFDFSNDVLCPLLGRLIKKKVFEQNGKKLPSEMYHYVNNLKNKGEQFKLCKGLNIQDPIDLAHNLTKATKLQFAFDFCEMCDAAKNALEMLK